MEASSADDSAGKMNSAAASIRLEAPGAHAIIALTGAECLQWSAQGLELLWNPDPAIWAATAPILFPVCGWTREGRVRVAGQSYPLGLHGFAASQKFELESQTDSKATLVLRDSAETLALYPFGFELSVEYSLSFDALAVCLTVRNCGVPVMPYSCGLHPGFRWPFDGGKADDYRIEFDAPETPQVPVIAAGGLFSARSRSVAMQGAELPLSGQTFAQEALCFLNARSQGLRFTRRRGRALRVETVGFPHIVLWSRPGADFLCIESWTGYGDPEGYDGELAGKPSMIHLSPACSRSHRVRYSLEAADVIA